MKRDVSVDGLDGVARRFRFRGCLGDYRGDVACGLWDFCQRVLVDWECSF